MADQTIQCIDCSRDFQYTEGEQTFFAEKNLAPPKRCKECRAAKKQRGFKSKSETRRDNVQQGNDVNDGLDGSDEI